MDIGDFDRLVLVRHRPLVQGDYGDKPGPWEDVCSTWANIRHQSGAEAVRGGAVTSLVGTSVRLWGYRTDLRADMVALDVTGLELPAELDQADTYNIQAVLPDKSGREWVDLVCELLPKGVGA